MGKVKRAETVNPARKVGRNDAIKKRLVPFTVGWIAINTTLTGT